MSGWRGSFVLVVLAGGLAGCSVVLPGAVTHYTWPPATLQHKVDCLVPSRWIPGPPTDPESKRMGSVPDGFVPVDVVLCQPPETKVAGDGTTRNTTVSEEHLSGDYRPLLAALAEPSDRQNGVSCTDQGETLPELWLVDVRGRTIHVKWPLDACSRSKPEVRKALAQLTVGKTVAHPVAGAA